jgi:mono/diheme cytochrome c family protein
MAWGVVMTGCGGKRSPGLTYMPDMAYSRAYETYASTANLDSLGIHYDKQPVPGTVKRGELFPFPYRQDAGVDSTNYILSKQVANPLDSMDAGLMKEAERLYLVNCAICHGGKLDGNGPLYNSGNGPYAAAPRNLLDPYSVSMPDGQMFYSITYGKGQMGPYGPQLSTSQRWMIVNYIRGKQSEAGGGPSPTTAANRKADSTAAAGVNVTDTTALKNTKVK